MGSTLRSLRQVFDNLASDVNSVGTHVGIAVIFLNGRFPPKTDL